MNSIAFFSVRRFNWPIGRKQLSPYRFRPSILLLVFFQCLLLKLLWRRRTPILFFPKVVVWIATMLKVEALSQTLEIFRVKASFNPTIFDKIPFTKAIKGTIVMVAQTSTHLARKFPAKFVNTLGIRHLIVFNVWIQISLVIFHPQLCLPVPMHLLQSGLLTLGLAITWLTCTPISRIQNLTHDLSNFILKMAKVYQFFTLDLLTYILLWIFSLTYSSLQF